MKTAILLFLLSLPAYTQSIKAEESTEQKKALSVDEFIAINEAAEKIFMQSEKQSDKLENKAQVNKKQLREMIGQKCRDCTQNYDYFRSLNEKARAMVFLGQANEALLFLKKMTPKFKLMDRHVSRTV